MAPATPNGLFHWAIMPKCPNHKAPEKSVPCSKGPKVADTVIKAGKSTPTTVMVFVHFLPREVFVVVHPFVQC
jgi:hypothetical protein